MAKPKFIDAIGLFMRKYSQLEMGEYMKDESVILEIPSVISQTDECFFLRDLLGRPVDVGDVVALGHPKYVDIRVGVVVGFTAKSVRVCIFRESEYRDTAGLSYPTFINGTFMIVRKKHFKSVD